MTRYLSCLEIVALFAIVLVASAARGESYSVETRFVRYQTTDKATVKLLNRASEAQLDAARGLPVSEDLAPAKLLEAIEQKSTVDSDLEVALELAPEEMRPFRLKSPGVYIDGHVTLKASRAGGFRVSLDRMHIERNRRSEGNNAIYTSIYADCTLEKPTVISLGGLYTSETSKGGQPTDKAELVFLVVRVSKAPVTKGPVTVAPATMAQMTEAP